MTTHHIIILTTLLACEAPIEDLAQPLELDIEFRVGPSSGCDNPHTTSGSFTFDLGGVTRNYRIDAPPGWDGVTPLPVVYTFHACGADHLNGSWNSFYSRTNQQQWLAPDLEPYAVLTVMGDAASTCWDVAPTATDLSYYDTLRATVEANYCIDGEKRYHAGVSSGGFAAQAFACRRDGVAAVWSGLGGLHHAVNPYGVTPHMSMASTTDTIVPPNTYTRPARDRWLQINGCDPESGVAYSHRVPGADPVAGVGNGNACTGHGSCECLEYTCTGARTVWCEFAGVTGNGNGHQWPIYYRDAAANWLGRFTDEPELPGSESSAEASSSSSEESTTVPATSEDSSTTSACDCECP